MVQVSLLDNILSSVTHYFLQVNSVLIIIDLVLVLVLGLECLVLVLILGLEGQVLVNITAFLHLYRMSRRLAVVFELLEQTAGAG